ncbi:thioredoxin domain-containing protein [Flindersiella endophytica]
MTTEPTHHSCCTNGTDTKLVPAGALDAAPLPPVVDRATFQAELDELRLREKALTREYDQVSAARRRLPMVEVSGTTPVVGPNGPVTLLEAFEGRKQLMTYYFMWYPGRAAADQCEGCTWNATQVAELSYLHSRDITYAIFCQGPYAESRRYRDFMGWTMPWYSAQDSLDTLLVGRTIGMMHLVCYVREGDRVFETYWTTRRGVEAVDCAYSLMDLTVYGRQEPWEDSPAGWPQPMEGYVRLNGRPIPQWSRIEAGRSDDLTGTA